jgi:peptidoglycan/LPS O-acetylase OafA/YrhL
MAWTYDLLVILLLFPALIYLAASADFARDNSLVRFLADISYPLYAVHLPILMAISGALKQFTHNGSHPPAFLYVLSVPIILFAYALGNWYESPVRRWLRRRLFTNGRVSA